MKTAMYLWRYSSTGGIYMALTHLTSATFDQAVNAGDDVVVVDFFATWCGPCKMMAPVVEALASEYEGKAVVGKLNVDDASDIAGRYGVMSIPTLIVFKNGQISDKFVGVTSKNELSAALNKAL